MGKGVKTCVFNIKGEKFVLRESKDFKVVKSENYNYTFDKRTGFFARWGKTQEDDPKFSPIGPEILDLEISVNGCPNACPFCLPAGAQVNIPKGTKSIEEVLIGDKVLGYDFESDQIREQIVRETYVRDYEGDLVIIQLEDGRIVELTADHRVMLRDGSQKAAGELTEQDDVIII